jgi:DmsE family decaheme c-type cytochrome
VKNCDRRAVDIASNEASSAKVPQKTKFKLSRKFLFFTASALIVGASLGLTQSVKADGTLTVAGIQSVLQGEPQALKSQQTTPISQQDAALSALSSFAQQIDTPAASTDRRLDDQAFAALQGFAQRLGTAQPQSIKTLPQVADADSLMDFLQQRGSAQGSPGPDKATAPVAGSKKSSAPVDAHFVGGKACQTCHAPLIAEFEKTLMGRIGKTQKGKFECENCHGPGSAHVKAGGGRGVGGIISFRPEDQARTAEENNGVCLACHERGDRTYWNGSTHETRGLMCTNCHTIMKVVSRKSQLKTVFEPDTCFQCHKDRRAQMYRSSHMPLREGKITCTDCHNPHGSATEALLRENSVNDNCYKCHAEKRGPFLWEHAPVRENCLNCHEAHGSTREFMLKMPRPKLCAECHGFDHGTGLLNNQFQRYIINKGCGNCHVKIHGSNHPSGVFFER